MRKNTLMLDLFIVSLVSVVLITTTTLFGLSSTDVAASVAPGPLSATYENVGLTQDEFKSLIDEIFGATGHTGAVSSIGNIPGGVPGIPSVQGGPSNIPGFPGNIFGGISDISNNQGGGASSRIPGNIFGP
jgi:hypothetical protein